MKEPRRTGSKGWMEQPEVKPCDYGREGYRMERKGNRFLREIVEEMKISRWIGEFPGG